MVGEGSGSSTVENKSIEMIASAGIIMAIKKNLYVKTNALKNARNLFLLLCSSRSKFSL